MELAGTKAIVTGGSRGIGRGIALALAAQGVSVVLSYSRRAEQAREVVAEISAGGGKALAVQADVARPEEVRRLVETALRELGSVEILVNNAGIDAAGRTILDTDDATWERVIAVNLTGVFACCRAVAPHMTARRVGRIVTISSIAGLRGSGSPAYVASKSGVIGLTMCLARELVDYGITVNAVAPGWVDTELLGLDEEQRRRVGEEVPVGWIGQPAHIADTVLFLLRNDYVTGQIINVSGGRMIGL
jgi:3-oxoacyl-[acyl-carrier protein] reductase